MVRIACVGITVMDRIYYVEGLPTEAIRTMVIPQAFSMCSF